MPCEYSRNGKLLRHQTPNKLLDRVKNKILALHRNRARCFVDIQVVRKFNPKMLYDRIDFPLEILRPLDLTLIASLLLSVLQRG